MTQQSSNIHLVIITGQAQANLIPILHLQPKVIALAVSQDMEKAADEFIKLLQRLMPVVTLRFDNVPSVGLAAIEKKATDIYHSLQTDYPDSTITYHATGGTKLMLLGFYNVFATENNSVIYNDTEHAQIEIVYPRNELAISVKHLLNAKTYLRSLGFELSESASESYKWTVPAKTRQAVTHWLADNAEELNNFFGDINSLVAKACDSRQTRLIDAEQDLPKKPSGIYQTALEKLNEAKICQWRDSTPQRIKFTTVNNAKYLSGAWLEEYVWLIANDLDISEVKANVKFSPLGDSTIDNEIDAIAVHNNRLLAIECKTASLERDTKNTNSMLYKLDALSKGIGGLYHERWLVSARPVPEETQKRADNSKIKIITPEQLKDLKTALENWRDAKR